MEALWSSGPSLGPRDSGVVSRQGPSRLYDRADPRLPARSQEGVRRVKKIGNAHIFEAAVSRAGAQHRLIDELLGFFGGKSQPVMARLIETGQLTLDDVKEAEQLLKELEKKDGRNR